MHARAARSYQNVDLESAPKTQILERLFARFARDCSDAERAIGAKDVAAKGKAIDHASSILVQLRGALDHAAAPELAANLDRLYLWASEQLALANLKQNVKQLKEAAKVMASLGDAFAKAHLKLNYGPR